jgi:flagellar L-ring protein precursor FlgH
MPHRASPRRRVLRLLAGSALIAAVSACHTLTRVSEIGDYPNISEIANPQYAPGYRPVHMPMPAPQPLDNNPNSLWRPGARAFFKDIRAKEIGDPLTVRLRLNDLAKWKNGTDRERDDSQGLSVDALMGFETKLHKILPGNVNSADLFRFSSGSETQGTGGINRSERMDLTFAALVIQVLPNGSLVVRGQQEVRVNFELRTLVLTGIVRPQDIEADNTVSHERIAEMRLAYGGRGTLSDLQQPRWGTQLLDIVLPF